jgi:hypothetical protein
MRKRERKPGAERHAGPAAVADQALHLIHQTEDMIGLPRRTTLLPFLLYAIDREAGGNAEAKFEAALKRFAVPQDARA